MSFLDFPLALCVGTLDRTRTMDVFKDIAFARLVKAKRTRRRRKKRTRSRLHRPPSPPAFLARSQARLEAQVQGSED